MLRCFQSGAAALSHGEIARLTGIPKPTVTRLVTTLMSVGFLRQIHGSDKYALSAGVLWLARAFLSNLDIRALARPHMAELAEWIGMSVYLGLRDGLEMTLIETCRSRSTMLFSRLDVGSRVPMLTSSLGRAYLSALDVGERTLLIEQLRLMSGAEWPRYLGGLERALGDAADFGYCLTLTDMHPDIASVAVALRTESGDLMALACAGPTQSFAEETLRDVVAPRLLETTRTIAREIGGSVPGPMLPAVRRRDAAAAKRGAGAPQLP